jgi:hypothetical protein
MLKSGCRPESRGEYIGNNPLIFYRNVPDCEIAAGTSDERHCEAFNKKPRSQAAGFFH